MKKPDEIVKVTFKIEVSKLALIDQFTAKSKIGSRSQLIRNLVDTGLEDMKFLQKTGLLHLALKGFDLMALVKKSIAQRKYEIEGEKLIINVEENDLKD